MSGFPLEVPLPWWSDPTAKAIDFLLWCNQEILKGSGMVLREIRTSQRVVDLLTFNAQIGSAMHYGYGMPPFEYQGGLGRVCIASPGARVLVTRCMALPWLEWSIDLRAGFPDHTVWLSNDLVTFHVRVLSPN